MTFMPGVRMLKDLKKELSKKGWTPSSVNYFWNEVLDSMWIHYSADGGSPFTHDEFAELMAEVPLTNTVLYFILQRTLEIEARLEKLSKV